MANTSSNSLVGKLLKEGSKNIKQDFERLLQKGTLTLEIDEQIVYSQLQTKKTAIWSLLLTSGYLNVVQTEFSDFIEALLPCDVEAMNYYMNEMPQTETDLSNTVKAALSQISSLRLKTHISEPTGIRRPAVDVQGSLGAETLHQRFFFPAFYGNHADLHVFIRQMRSRLQITFVIGRIDHLRPAGRDMGEPVFIRFFSLIP